MTPPRPGAARFPSSTPPPTTKGTVVVPRSQSGSFTSWPPPLPVVGLGQGPLEAKKSRQWVQGPNGSLGDFFAVPLTQTRQRRHSRPGVKAPTPPGRPRHEPHAEPRTRRRGRHRPRRVRPPGDLTGHQPGDGRGLPGADLVRLHPRGPLPSL